MRMLSRFRVFLLLCLPTFSYAAGVDDPNERLQAGQTLYTNGRYAEAQAAFEEAVGLQPKSAPAHYWLGMALYQQQQDKEALKQFKRAVKLNWKMAEGHIGIGLVYLRMKKRRFDARAELETAAKLDPTSAQIQYYLGMSYIGTNSLAQTRGYGAYVDGQKFFKRAIDLDPEHPDAFYQLARSYEFPSREYHKAIPLYFQQALVNPHHQDALDHFGTCCLETRRYDDGVAMLDRLAEVHGENADPIIRTIRLQLTAESLQMKRDFEQSLAAYEAYLEKLDPEERALYTDLSFVAPEDIAEQHRRASEQESAEIRRQFWAARDPDPSTEVNERLIEHYRRVMYARIHFSRGQSPWDRRGEIYVRYGEPDDRQNIFFTDGEAPPFPSGNSAVDHIRSMNQYRLNIGTGGLATGGGLAFKIESWVYVPYKLELFFVDQMGREQFDFPLPVIDFGRQIAVHPRRMADALIKRIPDGYQYDYGGLPLDVTFDVVTFKEMDSRTLIDIAYSIPVAQLGQAGDGRGMTTWLDSRMILRDKAFHKVLTVADSVGPIERPLNGLPEKQTAVPIHTAMLSAVMPAGQYLTALAVRDQASRRVGIYQTPITVSDYSGDSLMVSDIRLSTSIKPTTRTGSFVRHGLEIIPHPTRAYGATQPVYFYYEVYNLSRNEATGRSSYQTELKVTAKEKKRGFFGTIAAGLGRLVRQSKDDQSVILIFEDEGTTRDSYQYRSIETGDSPDGIYGLTLTITDLHSGQQVSKSTEFTITKDAENGASDG